MIVNDRRLRALYSLLRRVEGDDVACVQDAIRRHRHLLEDRQIEAGNVLAFGRSPSVAAAREGSDEWVLPVEGGHPDEVRRSAGSRAASP